MLEPLPAEIVHADARLHDLHAAIRFSAHLNPENIAEARAAFFAGAEAPPFVYAPAGWAEEARELLDGLVVPIFHPLGVELAAAIAETRALVVALEHRDPLSFERLAALADWLPDDTDPDDVPAAPPAGPLVGDIAADRMLATFRDALRRRGLDDWQVGWDTVLSSRVLVDSARRSVRVNPAARFRDTDRAGLVAHEIDVHATRGNNGEAQPLHIFATGLARSLLTEEGLAIVAEERVRALSPGFVARQSLLIRAVRLARTMGFRDLYEALLPHTGRGGAWQIALRVKRGLADPGAPGVYAKDTVYLRGYRRVRAWLDAGGDLRLLYVGKVGVHHPVGAWIRAGWVSPGFVPDMWERAA
ncbi:MAG: tyrosine/phenylalanine carboxypeptidase domain-containing protein [Myxococcota bacterium]